MRSSGFITGFEKSAGILGAVAKPVKWVGKKLISAGGGKLNVGLTGLGAMMEGKSGYDKVTAQSLRG